MAQRLVNLPKIPTESAGTIGLTEACKSPLDQSDHVEYPQECSLLV